MNSTSSSKQAIRHRKLTRGSEVRGSPTLSRRRSSSRAWKGHSQGPSRAWQVAPASRPLGLAPLSPRLWLSPGSAGEGQAGQGLRVEWCDILDLLRLACLQRLQPVTHACCEMRACGSRRSGLVAVWPYRQ